VLIRIENGSAFESGIALGRGVRRVWYWAVFRDRCLTCCETRASR